MICVSYDCNIKIYILYFMFNFIIYRMSKMNLKQKCLTTALNSPELTTNISTNIKSFNEYLLTELKINHN